MPTFSSNSSPHAIRRKCICCPLIQRNNHVNSYIQREIDGEISLPLYQHDNVETCKTNLFCTIRRTSVRFVKFLCWMCCNFSFLHVKQCYFGSALFVKLQMPSYQNRWIRSNAPFTRNNVLQGQQAFPGHKNLHHHEGIMPLEVDAFDKKK